MSTAPVVAPTIKTISITGGAAEDFQKGKSTRRRRSRKSDESSGADSSVTFVPVEKPLQGGASKPVAQPTPKPAAAPTPVPESTTKLVLAPPKKRETRLLLKGPKVSTATTSGGATSAHSHTRKNVRKITLGLRSLTLKINKAKRIHKKVEEMKKDEVKALLLEKGLLKPGKKDPPESLMRQMYSDYLLITTKGM